MEVEVKKRNVEKRLPYIISAEQKIKKLSETPVTVHNHDPFWAFWGVPKMALGVPESKF